MAIILHVGRCHSVALAMIGLTQVRLHFGFADAGVGAKLFYCYKFIGLLVVTVAYLREDAAAGALFTAGDILHVFGIDGYAGRYLLRQFRHGRPWHLDTGVV